LDYLKNRAKSGDIAVLDFTFRNVSLGKSIERTPPPEGWEEDQKIKKKQKRPGPDGRDASRWYGRLRVQKMTLSVQNCAHAPEQSFHE
jgi:hypothetical protein